MKSSILALSALFAALVTGQSLSGLPTCAQTCVGSSLGGCGPLDIKCICSNKNFITDISCCIANKCSEADQETTIKFANQICAVVAVTLPQAAGCSGTGSAASTAATATTTPASSVASSGTASVTSTSTQASVTAAASTASSSASASGTSSASGSSGSVSAASTGSSSPTSSAPATSSSGAAGQHGVDTAMGAAGLAAAVFALL